MREGGLPLPLAFQYLILMIWRAFDLSLVMISSLPSKANNEAIATRSRKLPQKRYILSLTNFQTCVSNSIEILITKNKIGFLQTNIWIFIQNKIDILAFFEIISLKPFEEVE